MKLTEIREIQYHYTRPLFGLQVAGKIKVSQVYKDASRRTRVVGIDLKTGRDITLWPRNLGKPVKAR